MHLSFEFPVHDRSWLKGSFTLPERSPWLDSWHTVIGRDWLTLVTNGQLWPASLRYGYGKIKIQLKTRLKDPAGRLGSDIREQSFEDMAVFHILVTSDSPASLAVRALWLGCGVTWKKPEPSYLQASHVPILVTRKNSLFIRASLTVCFENLTCHFCFPRSMMSDWQSVQHR